MLIDIMRAHSLVGYVLEFPARILGVGNAVEDSSIRVIINVSNHV
jgi:hypothetical protein